MTSHRRPPEWEAHTAVWLAWPRLADEWLGDLASPRRAVANLCAAIADIATDTGLPRGERIELLVHDDACEASARAALEVPVRMHRVPYGDIWLRDTGPVWVTKAGARHALRFRFNGWGGEYLFEHDPEVAARIAALTDTPLTSFDWVAEGGGLEVDGAGLAMTTSTCLLNDNRNPGMTRDQLERQLGDALGVAEILWLEGCLANDHTDGHIDTLARFIAPGRVVCMEPRDTSDPNYETLRGLIAQLEGRVELTTIPSPGRVEDPRAGILAASYVNFYIANTAVVVPVYGVPADDAAVSGIADAFPDRRTLAVDARALVLGGGAFHCITQEQP